MPAQVQRAPDGHRLGGKAAVGVADQEATAGPEHPPHLGEDFDRPGEVLDADAAQRGIDPAIGQGQARVAVQVLHESARQPGVGVKLGRVHTMADHRAQRQVVGQVANPARHEIEHVAAGRDSIAIVRG
jgi:hypothetical protein